MTSHLVLLRRLVRRLVPARVSPSVATAVVLIGLTWLLVRDGYLADVAVGTMIAGFVAIGLRLLVGLAGQISIGHAGFFAMGAYGSTLLCTRLEMASLAAIAIAAGAAAVVAVALGAAVLRLKGLYLAMATLGFGTIVHVLVNTETTLTGGPDGMGVPVLSVLGFAVQGRGAWFALAAGLLLGGIVLSERVQRSAFGHALQATGASESAAASCGVEVTGLKVKVFALSAAMASLGGSLSAHHAGYVTPQVSSFTVSVEFLAMVIIGGSLSVLGPVFGAVVFTTLPIMLAAAPEGVQPMVFGALLVAVLIAMPQGLEARLRSRLPSGPGR
ncbi:MAG TPA: branched-chain amino acid ABC transporter permease [Burkholderiaceae bacterium]|nr:branched-chain amino acid ABC transporter permease [Burkholderiaceae bacterium]